MTRIIHCPGAPAGRRDIPLGKYVAAIKVAKANPDVTFKYGLTTWWPTTGREIIHQFRRGMHERINAGTPYVTRGMEP